MYKFSLLTKLQGSNGQFVVARQLVASTVATFAAVALLGFGLPTRSEAAQPPERSLVGIKIFDKASLVLKIFGNPNKIITGVVGTAPTAPTAAPPMPGPGASEFNNGGLPSAGATGPATPSALPSQVIYEYVTKQGTTLDFTISADGRVIQISAAGQKNPNVKTLRGVTFGSSYIDIINKYGYPESQDTLNSVLTMKYVDRAHVAFQLFNQKVVSVTVAAVE